MFNKSRTIADYINIFLKMTLSTGPLRQSCIIFYNFSLIHNNLKFTYFVRYSKPRTDEKNRVMLKVLFIILSISFKSILDKEG